MRLIRFVLLFFFFVSCQSAPPVALQDSIEFQQTVDQFLQAYWQNHPGTASQMGMAQYDGELEVPTPQWIENRKDFYKRQLSVFEAIDIETLSVAQRTDLKLILNELKGSLWNLEVLRSHEWNPSYYNMGTSLSSVLEKESRSLEERLTDIGKKLQQGPAYYKASQDILIKPTKEHTELAIKQAAGFHTYLQKQLKSAVAKSKLKYAEKKQINKDIQSTLNASRSYVNYLRQMLNQSKKSEVFRSFRLGKELYEQKFSFDLQVEASPQQLYKKALDTREDVRSKMFELAIELYPKYFGEKLPPKDRQSVIVQVLSKVSSQHTKPEKFVETVEKQIPELVRFIQEKNILTLDPKKPLKVRETPTYQRGFAGASVDSPGPFDKFRETYYNVTPLDGMSRTQQMSYLREYNNYTLQILNIHEAVPGHYVQLVYSNQSPSLIKSIFGNGPMVEGWAVYTERMMLEEGYGNQSPELWLMYYKWFLRVVTNTILDYEVHNKDLSKSDAMKMMMELAFQEKAEAEGKWTRATVSQVQLASYFAGFNEIYSLREKIKVKEGPQFSLKNFHETFLSFGSAPVKEIKELML